MPVELFLHSSNLMQPLPFVTVYQKVIGGLTVYPDVLRQHGKESLMGLNQVFSHYKLQ
jgi:hypothetical protein